MPNHLFQFGINPSLSRAEIAAVLPNFKEIAAFSPAFVVYEGEKPPQEPQEFINRLGGVIRLGEFLGADELPKTIQKIADFLAEKHTGQSKITFGISCFNFNENHKILLETKKSLKKKGFSVRFANRNFQNLDAGTLHKEKLLGEKGSEIVILRNKNRYFAFATVGAQDVERFAERDFKKPVRDMQVGMLPPKLALMMLNLTSKNGVLPASVWDPFCGTGTVLVEAQNLGISATGSDIAPAMITASEANFKHFFPEQQFAGFVADAGEPLREPLKIDAICSETFLGPMFSRPLSPQDMKQALESVSPILERFFTVLHRNFTGERAVIAIPFWQLWGGGEAFLEKPLEIARKFWENDRVFFGATVRGSLLFRRENQNTGREIFVLRRKH